MAKIKSLPDIASEIYGLLTPLESDDRQRAVAAAMTLLGEQSAPTHKQQKAAEDQDDPESPNLGVKAKRWISQNGVDHASLNELFHITGDSVEVIAGDVAGNGKKAKTINCYLLSGIRSLLATDEPKFTEAEVVDLCKSMGCHDSPNHSKTRNELGNAVAGTKSTGYTLPQPGLRMAAELVKQMATPS